MPTHRQDGWQWMQPEMLSFLTMDMNHAPIYTIGYGAREIEPFIEVLKALKISYLLDVRSKPYSRYKPDFSKNALANHLQDHGIRYIFMGDTLGGQPVDSDCYDEFGKVDYHKVRDKPFFQEGIRRVKNAWQQQLLVVLMCSEGKPEVCHRSKLIARALIDQGINIAHIDENDQIISQEEVMLRFNKGQPSLFGDDFFNLTSRKVYKDDSNISEE